jgi:hypothetical protein
MMSGATITHEDVLNPNIGIRNKSEIQMLNISKKYFQQVQISGVQIFLDFQI